VIVLIRLCSYILAEYNTLVRQCYGVENLHVVINIISLICDRVFIMCFTTKIHNQLNVSHGMFNGVINILLILKESVVIIIV
jgi:hypothetical protein